MTAEQGLHQAWHLDGTGNGEALDWPGVNAHHAGDELLWVDLDYRDPKAERWLNTQEHIPEIARRSMLAEETRPNTMVFDSGLLIMLRGVNLNEGAEVDDMISVRVWIDAHQIITCRHRELKSIKALSDRIGAGKAPRNMAEMLIELVGELAGRISPVVNEIEDLLDCVEKNQCPNGMAAEEIYGILRRRSAVLLRYLVPQREALQRLQAYTGDLLDKSARDELQIQTDIVLHSIEDLEVIREHTQSLQDELFSAMARKQNERMYMLTIVAAIFLPLTFISGLLGMNVGGVPLSASALGFTAVTLSCIAIAILMVFYFRSRDWL